MKWSVSYLDSVEEWLDCLDKAQFKSLAKEIKLLELCGSTLKLPHSRPLVMVCLN